MIEIFTGIVEELGVVNSLTYGSNSCKIKIQAEKVVSDVNSGDSIAINGVCLTVIEYASSYFIADVMAETIAKTNLKELRHGNKVNLERAVRVGDRMGGHMVQGHVDGVGILVEEKKLDIARVLRIKAADELSKYMVSKGSIAIDGISLTIVDVLPDSFTVSLIPHTAEATTLGFKQTGDTVNLETDIIGRYIEKFTQLNIGQHEKEKNNLSKDFLIENGFV